ncbi:MAG: thioredoxin TrxA [Gammaproteobacteria bacterium]|jgi:thioredoxin 1|uniref:Thioredoxin n=1 Tax=Marinomonas polaris DSM 16579 TaxID=1122206 RepID=A0A1M5M282_9GAMM|nr:MULTISPECIES: thioredoxin TrxA [Marinomonas]MBU1293722.1 thioredoxin TrxA [Gammaproteobacteria bacterium]MBU1466752.1 thioredoxin TrxA [Gammaproteobacteria bacterium]MBU2024884.1 thioredoxin TrxA [Gammaproteobacteria bacterium]MBU2240583.1 thioredoxin TrxA [Gammaproteobacteria bacterium]MBU2319985.1 thioredoxin TrxA [Gammaproteobacteria bacterium]|tara:strand:+ start:20826 stop:21152 length:327 start_codon:yes stop_codon:yes gene_type:complete
MSENTIQITDAQFAEEVLNSDIPVIVDFWAPWCGPCKMIAPVLEDVAAEYAGKVKVVKLNVDENQETAPKYNVRGIPTLLIVKGGEVVATKVGAVSKSQLVDFVNSAI